MHLIVGLGNPGKKYQDTRHNAGFIALDYVREEWAFPEFRERASYFSEYSEGRIGGNAVILARPATFMNLSGKSVQAIASFFKIPTENIALIHDDLDIMLGEIRTSFDSRSAGHRGVESVINILGTKKFFRFRIGIQRQDDTTEETVFKNESTEHFVLDPFSPNERSQIEKLFPSLTQSLNLWIRNRTSLL